MGIQYLTSFMRSEQGRKYYTPFKLTSSYVIMDGSLYLDIYNSSNDDTRFGGDCKKMYDATYQHFKRFVDCDVTPIVVMGGLPSGNKSADDCSKALKNLIKYSSNNYECKGENRYYKTSVLFRASAFYEALDDLDIFYCRCDFDKCPQIFELARKLKCPVISNNSDFYVFNGITFLHWEAMGITQNKNSDYIECFKFDKEKLLEDFGISFLHLPYLAILFESDHCSRNLYTKVLDRKDQNKTRAALMWLQGETIESAKEKLLNSVAVGKRDDLEKEICVVFDAYLTSSTTLSSVLEKRFNFKNVKFNIRRDDLTERYHIPFDYMELARTCKLPLTILEMIMINTYWLKVPLEDVFQPSIFIPSIPLIRGIYGLLLKYNYEKPPLKLFIRENADLTELEVEPIPISHCFLTANNAKNIFLQIVSIDASVYESVLKFFDQGWIMFALALIYFARECKNSINKNHIHSIILTAVVLHIVKIYESNEDSAKSEEVETLLHHFKNLEREKLKNIVKKSMKLNIRKSDKVVLSSISNIHNYLTFQSCLFYVKHLFRLLQFPHEIKISRFISGSFYYSLSKGMAESSMSNEDWVKLWFEGDGKLLKLYFAILDNLTLM